MKAENGIGYSLLQYDYMLLFKSTGFGFLFLHMKPVDMNIVGEKYITMG